MSLPNDPEMVAWFNKHDALMELSKPKFYVARRDGWTGAVRFMASDEIERKHFGRVLLDEIRDSGPLKLEDGTRYSLVQLNRSTMSEFCRRLGGPL